MSVTLSQLLTAVSADQEKATILARLGGKGFPITDWVEGGIERTIVEAEAAGLSDLSSLIPAIAAGGFLSTSTSDWLTLLAHELYEIDRHPALPTIGIETLTLDVAGGPYTIVPGQLTFRGAGGNVYTNTSKGTLKTQGFSAVTQVGDGGGQLTPFPVAISPVAGKITPYRQSDQNGFTYRVNITGTGGLGVGTFQLFYVAADGVTLTPSGFGAGVDTLITNIPSVIDPFTGVELVFNVLGGDFQIGDFYFWRSGGELDLTIQSAHPNDSANGLNYIDGAGTINNFVTPLPGVVVSNPAPLFSTVAHGGTGSGTMIISAKTFAPVGVHSYTVTITASGDIGTAMAELRINGGMPFSIGTLVSGLISPGVLSDANHNVTLQFIGGASNSFQVGDTYAAVVPGTWVTQQGTDQESDVALATRCAARWPSLGATATPSVYDLWARTASAQVTRTFIQVDPAINDQINVVIAGQNGSLPSAVQNTVQYYLNQKAGITDRPLVSTVGTLTIELKTNIVQYHQSSNLAAIQQAVFAAVSSYLNRVNLGPSIVRVTDIISAIATGSYSGQPVTNPVLTSGIVDIFGSNGTPQTFVINGSSGNKKVLFGQMPIVDPSLIGGITWVAVP